MLFFWPLCIPVECLYLERQLFFQIWNAHEYLDELHADWLSEPHTHTLETRQQVSYFRHCNVIHCLSAILLLNSLLRLFYVRNQLCEAQIWAVLRKLMANCKFGKTCLTSGAPDSLTRKRELAGFHTQWKVTVSGLLDYWGSGLLLRRSC